MQNIERLENALLDSCIPQVSAPLEPAATTTTTGENETPGTSSIDGHLKRLMNDMQLSKCITELKHEYDDAIDALARSKVPFHTYISLFIMISDVRRKNFLGSRLWPAL